MSDIDTLRTHLFATLEGLKDGSISLEKAKAINETAQVLVNVAKVETDYVRATRRASASGFFAPTNHPLDALPVPGGSTTTPTAHGEKTVTALPGGATSTVHRMR